MGHVEIRREAVDWIFLDRSRDQWRTWTW